MKITDLTFTLFAWPGIPATTYGRHTGRFSGESQLGLVTLRTDGGLEGHTFLGFAMRGANFDARGLVHAPEGPGRGAAIDFDLIAHRKTAILS